MNADASSPPPSAEFAAGGVVMWGVPDRDDLAKGQKLSIRARSPYRRWIWLAASLGCIALAGAMFTQEKFEAGGMLLFILVMIVLRIKVFRRAAITRLLTRAQRVGGCPYWGFKPEGISFQNGSTDSFFQWQLLDGLAVNEDLIVLINDRFSFSCAPIRFFKNAADVEAVMRMARASGLPVSDFRKKPAA